MASDSCSGISGTNSDQGCFRDDESTCSTSNSEDSIVESKNVNTVDTEISNMNIDDQLKMIREEKH